MGRVAGLLAAGLASVAAAAGANASASVAAAAGANASACDALLFVFFRGDEKLYYAYSKDGLHWTDMNKAQPVYAATVAGTSIRDPYVHAGPDGVYRMVSTDGNNFGGNPNILTWNSTDLIHWSSEVVAPVMGPQAFPPPATVVDTWAPEWVYSEAEGKYLVFWAAKGTNLPPVEKQATGPCNNTNMEHFVFLGTWTTDFQTFGPGAPFVVFDAGCNATTSPAGDGGIDGDIVVDENGVFTMVYKDARGAGETVRGVRSAVSSTGRVEGPYLDASISPLLAPTLVEAPEAVFFPDPAAPGTPRWLLYYDCSFMPTPPGWPRPPYGVSVSPSLANANWTQVPGACTGDSPDTAFPKGATHGSFVCLSADMLAALLAAFPV
jgi:hypothetical protein